MIHGAHVIIYSKDADADRMSQPTLAAGAMRCRVGMRRFKRLILGEPHIPGELLVAAHVRGEERSEIEKIVAGMPKEDSKGTRVQPVESKAGAASDQSISGTITLDPKLKSLNDGQATLFIIARPSGGSAGPPLAVKKIDRPVFPLSYSIGGENVMMQGTPFSGKINLSVRLDKDGNPTTRTAGDLLGDYKKNPAQAGSKNIDIVIDQAM